MTSIKRGDTLPELSITCQLDGAPVDLSAGTVRIIGVRSGAIVIDRVIPGPVDGVVVLQWTEADTATLGALQIEVEVTWPDGQIQTWPGRGSIRVDVTPDLNPPTGA